MFISTVPRIRSISFCWILWNLFNAARHRLPQCYNKWHWQFFWFLYVKLSFFFKQLFSYDLFYFFKKKEYVWFRKLVRVEDPTLRLTACVEITRILPRAPNLVAHVTGTHSTLNPCWHRQFICLYQRSISDQCLSNQIVLINDLSDLLVRLLKISYLTNTGVYYNFFLFFPPPSNF